MKIPEQQRAVPIYKIYRLLHQAGVVLGLLSIMNLSGIAHYLLLHRPSPLEVFIDF